MPSTLLPATLLPTIAAPAPAIITGAQAFNRADKLTPKIADAIILILINAFLALVVLQAFFFCLIIFNKLFFYEL